MLSIKTILHPTDFSEPSRYAFDLACALARDHGGRVVVLHVAIPPSVVAFEGGVVPEPESNQRELNDNLAKVRPESPDIPVEHRLIVASDPVSEILSIAQDIKCDLLVMGTHGRTGLKRVLLGSVAEQVLRKADCPVLTIKKPSPTPEPSTKKRPRKSAAGT